MSLPDYATQFPTPTGTGLPMIYGFSSSGVGSDVLPSASLATNVNSANAGQSTAAAGSSGVPGWEIAGSSVLLASLSGTARPTQAVGSSHGGLSSGQTAGIAVGAALGGLLAFAGLGAWIVTRKRRARRAKTEKRTQGIRRMTTEV